MEVGPAMSALEAALPAELAAPLLPPRVAVGLEGVLVLLGARVAIDAEVGREVPGYA